MKTDISNMKSSNEDLLKSVRSNTSKIIDLRDEIRNLEFNFDRASRVETMFNTIKRRRIKKRDYTIRKI